MLVALYMDGSINACAVVMMVDFAPPSLVAFVECRFHLPSVDIMIIDNDSIAPLLASLNHAICQNLLSYDTCNICCAEPIPSYSSRKLDCKTLIALFWTHELEVWKHNANVPQDVTNSYAIPQTKLQALIRTLWVRILQTHEAVLGLDDDFYRADGNSISAILLASSARQAGLHLLATNII
ncbi:hypothetical protein K439DRAFT_1621864 [Ramaria rubella]|nr:hypothetical protein K439DRAFT_1621864 [Ramaria rubella]